MNLIINIFLILVLNLSVLVRPAFPFLEYLKSKEITSSTHSALVQILLEKAQQENKNIPVNPGINLLDAPIGVSELFFLNLEKRSVSTNKPIPTDQYIKTSDGSCSVFQPPEL